MAFIAPEGFIVNTNHQAYEKVRKLLVDNANLQSVISLPRGAFEPYNRAKADILFFTDCHFPNTKKALLVFQCKKTMDIHSIRNAQKFQVEMILK